MPMVSMWCERLLTNLRMYGSKLLHSRNAMVSMGNASRGKVKLCCYEIPCIVTGGGAACRLR